MKLKRVSVKGLNNKVDCDFEFHNDINIVTGINGCGKTTFLKMLWYAISGNIEHLISEISFESFYLETSHFSLSLVSKNSIIQWKYSDITESHEGRSKEGGLINPLIIKHQTSSLFFPTFRRIEGGYSMANVQTSGRIAKPLQSLSSPFRSAFPLTISILQSERNSDKASIKSEFDKLSNSLSIAAHKFICSISTYDLGLLLISRYAHASEKTNEDFLRFSTLISSQIEGIKSDIQSDQQEALTILSKLQQENNAVNNKRAELLKPFKTLSELVTKVLRYKGIKLDDFIIGESDDAIDSRLLSAGEQQILSFLCYNAFYEDSIIFIDEPELSLHVDWQRRLFPNLMKQQTSNQFIVATHSPCIYSKYEDKELILSEEKGG